MFDHPTPIIQKVSTIDANARYYEAELQAREERTERVETELHPEATVLTATAL